MQRSQYLFCLLLGLELINELLTLVLILHITNKMPFYYPDQHYFKDFFKKI
jgi:hypothetical protein